MQVKAQKEEISQELETNPNPISPSPCAANTMIFGESTNTPVPIASEKEVTHVTIES
jgi:hypothetical protein